MHKTVIYNTELIHSDMWSWQISKRWLRVKFSSRHQNAELFFSILINVNHMPTSCQGLVAMQMDVIFPGILTSLSMILIGRLLE